MHLTTIAGLRERPIQLPLGSVTLDGLLSLPPAPLGVVLLVRGDPGLPHSPAPPTLPESLHDDGLATLQLELLTADEQVADRETKHLRFNVALLAARLTQAIAWLTDQPDTVGLPLACVGTGSAGGAILRAVALHPDALRAVVLWGGRPDLVGRDLAHVQVPSLLLIDEDSPTLRELNCSALGYLGGEPQLALISRNAGSAPPIGEWLLHTLVGPTLAGAVGKRL